MAHRYRPRLTQANYRAIADQEFREIERERRLRLRSHPEQADGSDPVVYSTDPDPLTETETFLHAFRHVDADQRHPDTIGVSHRPEPKSITSGLPASRNGSFMKPKAKAGKIPEAQPYAYSREGRGRWQQRG